MNFVFVSPNFPTTYWQFVKHLHLNGANVLGIGEAPYEELHAELQTHLTEYYRVSSMEDYDQMYRAVAYFAFKYGKIDWLESNNEYWLQQDARLRTDFNINTGIKSDRIDSIKEKSEMKKYYAAGGIRTARQIKCSEGFDNCAHFAFEANYPIFAKPDVGVGAGGAQKIENEDELRRFFAETPQVWDYVIEEFVTGDICTYDAIIDSKGNPLFESMCVCPPSIAEIVANQDDMTYYVEKQINSNLSFWGRQTVKAFGVTSRFVHLEFFRLQRDHRGLGNVGDFVALEVNMRPGGGFTPDLINFAHDVDVYKIWADMVCFDDRTTMDGAEDYYTMFVGRRDGVEYVHGHEEVLERYKTQLKMWDRVPDALSDDLGNQSYIARFETQEEMYEFEAFATERK